MTAVTTHETIEWICGDTWKINGTILDEDGAPMSLTDIGINWKLDDMEGDKNLLDLSIGSGITIEDASAGTILIKVLPEISLGVTPGIYYDWLRITTLDNSVYTEWTGPILVVGNPKGAAVP